MLFLGYPNHAAYVQETKMAKNPDTVEHFLLNLKAKMKVLWEEEKKVLLNLKSVESEELGLEFNGKIEKEDFRFAFEQKMTYVVENQIAGITQLKWWKSSTQWTRRS